MGVPAQDAVLFLLGEGQGADGGHSVCLALPGAVGAEQDAVGAEGPDHAEELLLRHHGDVLRAVEAVVQGGQIPQGVGGVQIDGGVGQQRLHLVPVPPAAHVGQDEGHGAHLVQGAAHHPGGDVDHAGEAHIQSRVAEDEKPQLCRPVQDAEGADVVKIHPLIDGMELDPLQAQLGHPGQLGPVVGEVGVDAAEGEHAGLRKALIDLGGAVVDMDHLLGGGGHREDHGAVHSGPGHGGGKSGVGAVGEGAGMGHLLQLWNGGGGQPVGEGMGMDVDDHGDQTVPFVGEVGTEIPKPCSKDSVPHGFGFEKEVSCGLSDVFGLIRPFLRRPGPPAGGPAPSGHSRRRRCPPGRRPAGG